MLYNEEWKEFMGGSYAISSKGRVRNGRGTFLTPQQSAINERCFYRLVDGPTKRYVDVNDLMREHWPSVPGPFGEDWRFHTMGMNDTVKNMAAPAAHTRPTFDLEWWASLTYTPGCPDGAFSPVYMPLDYKELAHYGECISTRDCLLSSDSRRWFVSVHNVVYDDCHRVR
jgi:hypothetical protein